MDAGLPGLLGDPRRRLDRREDRPCRRVAEDAAVHPPCRPAQEARMNPLWINIFCIVGLTLLGVALCTFLVNDAGMAPRHGTGPTSLRVYGAGCSNCGM